MEIIDLLVEADYLYPMSAGSPIIEDGEVAIRADRIVYAGPRRPSGTWLATRTISGDNRAVLPGFVNCHTHVASAVFRSQTDDFDARYAIYRIVFRMEKDIAPAQWQDLALLGCADMIRSGVTTINDIWYNPDRLAYAVDVSGIRAVLANKVFDVRLEDLHQCDYTRYNELGERRLRDGVEFVETWHGKADGRIQGRLAPHATDTCSTALLCDARAEADRLGVGLHIHAAQSEQETQHIRDAHRCGPLEYLRDIGVLKADVIAAHLIFASDADLEGMSQTGAAYAHSPITYPRGGFYPRLAEIRKRDINTGFATDWMQNDPFEAMRNALNAVRLSMGDSNALSCEQALRYFTTGSASVLGMNEQIGSLEPGKKADLIMLDVGQLHLQPFYGAYSSIVFYAKASDVRTSIIDGTVVLDDSDLCFVDEENVLAAVHQHYPAWTERLRELGSKNLAFGNCC